MRAISGGFAKWPARNSIQMPCKKRDVCTQVAAKPLQNLKEVTANQPSISSNVKGAPIILAADRKRRRPLTPAISQVDAMRLPPHCGGATRRLSAAELPAKSFRPDRTLSRAQAGAMPAVPAVFTLSLRV